MFHGTETKQGYFYSPLRKEFIDHLFILIDSNFALLFTEILQIHICDPV